MVGAAGAPASIVPSSGTRVPLPSGPVPGCAPFAVSVSFTEEGRSINLFAPPLRPKRDRYSRCPVRLGSRRQQWSLPLLVLNERRNTQIAPYPPIQLYGAIIYCLAAGDEIAVHARVPVPEFKSVSWTKPIFAPRLKPLTIPSDPVSDDCVLNRVQVGVEKLQINVLCAEVARIAGWCVGVDRLEP